MLFAFFEVKAQDTIPIVSFSGVDVPLDRALSQLRRSYNVSIVYDSRTVRRYRVSAEVTNVRIDELLSQWLSPLDLSFEVINSTYVVVSQTDLIPGDSIDDYRLYGFTIHGRVFDAISKEPLPFANVSLGKQNRGTSTNELGWFILENVTSDTTTVVVSYIGYEQTFFVLGNRDPEVTIEVALQKTSAILPAATVQSLRRAEIIQRRSPSLITVDPAMAYSLPNTGESDPVRTLQLLPGVSGALENSANLHVRGGAADENLVIYDGFTIYFLDHFYGVFSAFNANGIKNIRLHKGVLEPAFGGRASSVLEITGKQGSTETTKVKTDLSLLSASVHLETPILGNRASMMLSGRRSFTDVLYSPAYQGLFNNLYSNSTAGGADLSGGAFGSGQEPDFNFYDLTAKIGWESDAHDRFSFTFYTGRDRLAMQFTEQSRDDRFMFEYNDQSRWGNTGVGARWAKQWDERSSGTLTMGYSTFQSELFGFDRRMNLFLGTQDTLFFDRNTEISDLTVRYDHEYHINRHFVKLGTHNTAFRVENSRLDSEGDFERVISAENQLSIYAQDQFAIRPTTKVTFGGRLNYYSGFDRFFSEPRILLEQQVGDAMTIHAAAGRTWQFIRNVRRQDLFLNTTDEWRLADGDHIPALSSDQLSLGFSLQKGAFNFDAEAYVKRSTGAVEDALRFISYEPGTFDNDLLIGNGIARGVELLLSKPQGRHTGWVAYTLSRATHRFDALDQLEVPAYFDRTHEAKMVYGFNPGRYRFNAVFVYATGLPFTAANGIYNLQLPNGEERSLVAFSNLNSSRLPDYHRLDLSGAYVFNLLSGQATAGISLYNVYGRSNIRNRYFFSSGSQQEQLLVDFNDLVFLGFVPTINFSFEW